LAVVAGMKKPNGQAEPTKKIIKETKCWGKINICIKQSTLFDQGCTFSCFDTSKKEDS